MQVPKLRDYQLKIISDIEKHRQEGINSMLIVLPTGAGKTILAGNIVQDKIEKKLRCWFLVHRNELIEQTAEKFALFGVEVQYIVADNFSPDGDAVLAMVQTLRNKIKSVPDNLLPDWVIVDESHKIAANTYLSILAELKSRKNIILLGLTATPKRLDGKGLSDTFQTLIAGPSMRELIDNGDLSKYKIFAPPNALNMEGIKKSMGEYDQKELTKRIEEADFFGDVVVQYQNKLQGKRDIIFAQNIEHSKHISDLFNKAGIPAAHVDADTPKKERREIIDAFKKNDLLVLSNVYLFAEGVDVPALYGVSMARPTASEMMYLQMAGRALRPFIGKDFAWIIDHVRNWETHGFPCMEREWLLEYPKKSKEQDSTLYRECPKCYVASHITAKECPECGYVFPLPEPEIMTDVEFQCYDPDGLVLRFKNKEERKRYINKELSKCHKQDDFTRLAIRAGYKPAWGALQYSFRQRNKTFRQNQGSAQQWSR